MKTTQTTQDAQNKCLFCGKIIGDYVSNYHIGCYKQKQLLEKKEHEELANHVFELITRFGIKHLTLDELKDLKDKILM